jgi:catechol 2,3-dioxygenase-like lactoylglutathione lyase family enzyme
MAVPTPVYHVAFLVADIAAASAHFAEVLGLSFPEPRVLTVQVAGRPGPTDLRLVYSVEGPPFVELIEARDDGYWSRSGGLGFHHVGVWQPDLDGRLDQLTCAGLTAEAVVGRPGGATGAVYLDPAEHLGVRLELVAPR